MVSLLLVAMDCIVLTCNDSVATVISLVCVNTIISPDSSTGLLYQLYSGLKCRTT